MIIYFSIYCFLGYIMESCYVSLLNRKWISSGLLKGPFIPLYGFGACLLISLSSFLMFHPLITFVLGGLLLTLLEYFASLYIENFFHTKCWDYSKHKFHYQGRICLGYSLIWCCLSYCLLFYIHPYLKSFPIMNDTVCVFSLIYLTFILKSLIRHIQFTKNNGLDFH